MNWKLPLLILCICVGVICVIAVANSSEEGVFVFPNITQDALSFEDLDARDANNQPIAASSAKQELKQIFQYGIFELLTKSELYSIATALSVLRKNLNLTAHAIARSLPQKTSDIFYALLPVRKNWDKLLVLLTNLFVFAVSCTLLSLLPNCFTPAAKSLALQVLRC
ncbi:MAG: hypothetical protein ABII64_07355 [Elusimicrobiota bacterium]